MSKNLDRLIHLLEKRPVTALQIASALGCSKPAAYRRVRALAKQGIDVVETKARYGKSGPKAIFYALGAARAVPPRPKRRVQKKVDNTLAAV